MAELFRCSIIDFHVSINPVVDLGRVGHSACTRETYREGNSIGGPKPMRVFAKDKAFTRTGNRTRNSQPKAQ